MAATRRRQINVNWMKWMSVAGRGWDCWEGRKGGGGERWRMDGRKTAMLLARSLARSLLMNETLKAPRRPRFHVVILRFIIHLSLPLSQHSLLSFLSYKQAAKAKKDQKSWKLPINLMKFHQPPAAIPDMESRGRASASGGIT